MLESARWLRAVISARLQEVAETRKTDVGASVVEVVIIAAGVAALALSVVAAITVLVNGKVAGIRL